MKLDIRRKRQIIFLIVLVPGILSIGTVSLIISAVDEKVVDTVAILTALSGTFLLGVITALRLGASWEELKATEQTHARLIRNECIQGD